MSRTAERPTLLLLGYKGPRGYDTRYAIHGTDGVVVKDVDLSALRMQKPYDSAKTSFLESLDSLDARELRYLDRYIARDARRNDYYYKQAPWARAAIAERLTALGPQPRRVNRTVLHLTNGWVSSNYVPVSHAVDIVRLDVTALRSTSRIDHVDEVRKAKALPPSLRQVLVERLQSWQSALKSAPARGGVAAELG
jgi:hypothetical protein